MCRDAHEDLLLEPTEYTAPPGAIYRGRVGLRSFTRSVLERFPRVRVEPIALDDLDRAVLLLARLIRDDTDGVQRAVLFEIEDGLVRRARAYPTVSQALEAATRSRANGGERILTQREREIFELLAQGMTAPEIARGLVLSPATVRTHVQNATVKLEASTRIQAIARAITRGEIRVDPSRAASVATS